MLYLQHECYEQERGMVCWTELVMFTSIFQCYWLGQEVHTPLTLCKASSAMWIYEFRIYKFIIYECMNILQFTKCVNSWIREMYAFVRFDNSHESTHINVIASIDWLSIQCNVKVVDKLLYTCVHCVNCYNLWIASICEYHWYKQWIAWVIREEHRVNDVVGVLYLLQCRYTLILVYQIVYESKKLVVCNCGCIW